MWRKVIRHLWFEETHKTSNITYTDNEKEINCNKSNNGLFSRTKREVSWCGSLVRRASTPSPSTPKHRCDSHPTKDQHPQLLFPPKLNVIFACAALAGSSATTRSRQVRRVSSSWLRNTPSAPSLTSSSTTSTTQQVGTPPPSPTCYATCYATRYAAQLTRLGACVQVW